MSKIEFFEDVLHGEKSVSILIEDISLCMLDVIFDLPDIDGVLAAIHYFHILNRLIFIRNNIKLNNSKSYWISFILRLKIY